MARTSERQVKQILSTSLASAQINAFIDDASLWVDEELASEGFSASRFEIIERYLACALIRLRDLGLSQLKLDDINEKYQVDPEVTDYLIRAAAFDSSGTVRRYFLAGKDVRTAGARVGTLYVDEA